MTNLNNIIKTAKYPVLQNNFNANHDIQEIKILSKKYNNIRDSQIFISTIEYIIENKIKVEELPLIIIKSSKQKCEINQKLNAIILLSDEDIFDIFNNISELITIETELEKIAATSDLILINNIVSTFLNNPSIIIDSNYRIITHSALNNIKDEIWSRNISKGYCSVEFINFVQNLPEMIDNSNNNIIRVNCYASKIIRWTTKIIVEDTVVAHLIVLEENNKLSVNDMYFISKVAIQLKTIINNNSNALLIDSIIYESLLISLLDNKKVDQSYLESIMKANHKTLKKNISVMIINLDNYNYLNRDKKYLYQLLEDIIKVTDLFYNNSIILIYDFDNYPIFEDTILTRFSEFLNTQKLKLAISNNFSNILDLRHYYLQAKSLNDLNLSTNIVYYSDNIFELITSKLTNEDLNNYIHPCLKTLDEYDNQNNTELKLTLSCYLKNNQNSVLTSKELYIHRNTIKYRINKIIELTRINLTNSNEVFNLLLSFKLNK